MVGAGVVVGGLGWVEVDSGLEGLRVVERGLEGSEMVAW